MKKILGRILIVIPALALQIFWIYILFGGLDRILNGHLINVISLIFAIPAVLFVLSLVSKRDESSYKLLWVIVILIIPVFGAIMYAFLGNKQTGTRIKKKMINSAGNFGLKDYAARMDRSEEVIREDRRLGQSFRHVFEVTRFPVLKNGTSKYYSFGQYMFADMCTDLKTAQKYIFI